MKKNSLFVLVFCSLLITFFSSCATTLHVQVTRPAKLNLNGAKTIGILPFDESDKNPFNYFFHGNDNDINNYFDYYGEISRVERTIISYIKDNLEKGLMYSPYITLVNSRDIKNALKYGGKNPADVFIGGEIVSFRIQDNQHKVKHEIPESELNGDEKLPKYYYEYYYSRDVELIFNYEIVDGNTRRIIAHDTIKFNQSSGTYEKIKDLPNAFNMISNDIDYFIDDIMKSIQPYNVSLSIKLLEDKTDNPKMANADELANSGYYKESYSEFIKVYMNTRQFEAGYNAALILLAMGELQSAESLMNEVYQNFGDKRALDALYDIRHEIEQAKLLDNQINPVDDSQYDFYSFDYNEYN